MAKHVLVNKGAQIDVWSDFDGSGRKIGVIYTNEAYVMFGEYGQWTSIIFNNPSGQIASGFLRLPSNAQMSAMRDYPYSTAFVDGRNRDVFKMRRTESIKRSDNRSWGSVASGCRVVVDPDITGDENPTWCKVMYVENTSGEWIQVDDKGSKYGFLDMGLDNGSFSNTISMYGSW